MSSNVFDIYQQMRKEGVNTYLIRAIKVLVSEYEGAKDLLHLWEEAPSIVEKQKILQDFQEIVCDRFVYMMTEKPNKSFK